MWPWQKPLPPPLPPAPDLTAAILLGYRMAFDTLYPLIKEGLQMTGEKIRQDAMAEVLSKVEANVQQRVEAKVADIQRLRGFETLRAKQAEWQQKRTKAHAPSELQRIDCYLEAIGWVLNGRP